MCGLRCIDLRDMAIILLNGVEGSHGQWIIVSIVLCGCLCVRVILVRLRKKCRADVVVH